MAIWRHRLESGHSQIQPILQGSIATGIQPFLQLGDVCLLQACGQSQDAQVSVQNGLSCMVFISASKLAAPEKL